MVGARRTARATRAHPTSSWHWSRSGTGLLCAQKVLATSGILRMVDARPGARTRLRSTGRPLPAYSRRLASLQAARSLCHACGMHAARRQQQPCVWNADSAGTCVRHHGYRCDLIEINSPEWLPLAACSSAPDVSCIFADPRATGRPWATAGALSSHTSHGSSSLSRRCAVCAAGLGMDMPCDSCG